MSRSGYQDDLDPGDLSLWRGRIASALRGRRGQAFLTRLIAALDALPERALITDVLADGPDRCALGAALGANQQALSLDPDDHHRIGAELNISPCLVQEVEYVNDDEGRPDETPEQRWTRVRAWAVRHLKPAPASSG